MYTFYRYWTLGIHIGLYSEISNNLFVIGHSQFVQRISKFLFDIGNCTFTWVCTVDIKVPFRYWTLDIHMGLYSGYQSSFLLLDIGYSHGFVQWISKFLFVIGHCTFAWVCTVDIKALFRYWTLYITWV